MPLIDPEGPQSAFLKCALPLYIFFVLVAGMPSKSRAQDLSVLTTVKEIRSLSPDQAGRARPVRLRGVVTVLSGWDSCFFLQDTTAGISIERTGSTPAVQPGQLVEIDGVTGPGQFAPIVTAKGVKVIGPAKMPPARFFGLDELIGGDQDSQWLAMRGIVRSAEVQTIWDRPVLLLYLDIGAGNLVAVRILEFSKAAISRLPNSTISVRGVCGTVFNDKRQFLGLRLFVASLSDVKEERAAPSDPFDLPTRNIVNLLQFGDHRGGAIARVKVRGVVTYSRPKFGVYVQEAAWGVFVESTEPATVPVGAILEVVGYPAPGHYSPKLENAVFRSVGTTSQVKSLPRSASGMITDVNGFPTAPEDALLVQLKGRLIQVIPGSKEDMLLLRDGETVFSAVLPRSPSDRASFAVGSLLSITGICSAKADEVHDANSFEILLRSVSDVVVLERAPWWTAAHAGWVALIVVLVLVGLSAWAAIMQHQARLRAISVTDDLTGLYNRRGFFLFAKHQWQLASNKKARSLVFYLDVDEFKQVNDKFGHKEGDSALQEIAELLRECFRKTDILGRLGGDEFALYAVDSIPGTQQMLEQRISESLQRLNEKPGRLFQLSLSIGILSCDRTDESCPLEDLVVQADTLMFEQKRIHRNQGRR